MVILVLFWSPSACRNSQVFQIQVGVKRTQHFFCVAIKTLLLFEFLVFLDLLCYGYSRSTFLWDMPMQLSYYILLRYFFTCALIFRFAWYTWCLFVICLLTVNKITRERKVIIMKKNNYRSGTSTQGGHVTW